MKINYLEQKKQSRYQILTREFIYKSIVSNNDSMKRIMKLVEWYKSKEKKE